MSRRLAIILSYVFHPLLLSTYLVAIFVIIGSNLLFHPSYNLVARWMVVVVVLVTSCFIPGLSILLLKVTGVIGSLQLENRRERMMPFVYTAVFYAFTAYLFERQMSSLHLLSVLFVGSAIIISLLTLITVIWKISAHAAGVGGLLGYLIGFKMIGSYGAYDVWIIALVLVSGLVLAARIKLKAHSPAQAYAGFGLGLFISFITVLWI